MIKRPSVQLVKMDKRIELIAQLENLLEHKEDLTDAEIKDINEQLENAKNN